MKFFHLPQIFQELKSSKAGFEQVSGYDDIKNIIQRALDWRRIIIFY